MCYSFYYEKVEAEEKINKHSREYIGTADPSTLPNPGRYVLILTIPPSSKGEVSELSVRTGLRGNKKRLR
jgi:hypothetical protein